MSGECYDNLQNMKDKVELRLLGITYNQIESGVYALLLEDVVSKRRLAIVIGYPEAQSIECHLQKVKTPRPLSHDVMASIINRLNSHLSFVYIHKIPSGPYAAELHLIDEIGREIVIDSRSSDAIALAIRTGSPIYSSPELIETEGFNPESAKYKPSINKIKNNEDSKNTLSNLSISTLKKRLEEAVNAEQYEEASRIKQELDKRGINPPTP